MSAWIDNLISFASGLHVGKFVYDFQTLITGVLALVAAFIAVKPVYEQVRQTRVQVAINTRDVLLQRVRDVERLKIEATTQLNTIIEDCWRAIWTPDDESKADVNPEWAFNADQTIGRAEDDIIEQRKRSTETELIVDRRESVLIAAQELRKCLRDIHIPASTNFDDPDYELDEDAIKAEELKAAAAAKKAEELLPERIRALEDRARDLDLAFEDHLGALRTRIRKIDRFVLGETQRTT